MEQRQVEWTVNKNGRPRFRLLGEAIVEVRSDRSPLPDRDALILRVAANVRYTKRIGFLGDRLVEAAVAFVNNGGDNGNQS